MYNFLLTISLYDLLGFGYYLIIIMLYLTETKIGSWLDQILYQEDSVTLCLVVLSGGLGSTQPSRPTIS